MLISCSDRLDPGGGAGESEIAAPRRRVYNASTRSRTMHTTLVIFALLMVAGLVTCLVLYWKMKALLNKTTDQVERTAAEIKKQISRHGERTESVRR